ncbi:hypothetical protein H6F43_03990 [Leptolyngbya sp. FACHB-36]|uniref:hypothetical protein n=1 Tax=Leptolyngbya sp. FACHB-36 TaxID=2692808 RepID=UPI0016808409|nr:hypothetical protein [Leptolyngbya sp. FACHB-36]MBD2019344.1 hypothetical protein [Leptolyngbya sp. FACHB-36]
MATGVSFGQPRSLIVQPGSYVTVDSSALAIAPAFSFNTVCVLGAGLGGTPLTPYLLNDPIQAQQLFGATTPLSEAIRFAFQGGANGGASTVMAVRVDSCAQAVGSLPEVNGGAELLARFKDYGAYGNTFALSFYPGSIAGTMAVITGTNLDGTAYFQKIDNETSFSQLIERINRESPLTVEIVSGGTPASQTLTIATSQVDGRATVTDAQGVVLSNQAYAYQYPASMLQNTTDSMLVSASAAIGWEITSIDAATETFTTSSAHTFVAGSTVQFSGNTLPPEIDPTVKHVARATASPTTFQLATPVAPEPFAVTALNAGLFTVPGNTYANGDVVQLTGVQLPTTAVAERNYFVRDKSGDDLRLTNTVTGAAIAFTGTITALNITKVAGGLLGISGSISGARVVLAPRRTTITASNPSSFNGSREAVRTIDSYSQAITNATITATAYGSDTARITLQASEVWSHTLRRGLPGAIFQIASGVYSGTYQVLHHEWDGLGADKTRVVRKLTGDRRILPGSLSATLNAWGAIQFGKAQPGTAALETRLPANGLLATGGQYLAIVAGDKTTHYNTIPGDTVQGAGEQVAAAINANTEFPVIAAAAYNPATYTSTLTLVAKKAGTVPNAYPVSILVNEQTTLLVDRGGTTLEGGVEPLPPRTAQGVTSGTLVLTNGFDSVPTYQRWLDGLETVKYLPLRTIVPAGTDNLGVQIAVADHCTLMSSTPKRRERMCVLGHGEGWTIEQIRARAEVFQSERVVFVSPGFTSSDPITGNPKAYPATYMAAIVAGMLAAEGNGISDPITHTYLRNALRLEKTYQSGSVELDNLINSGVLCIEPDASLTRVSRGFRVARAITTWRVSVNSALKSNAFESISVVNQSDFIAAAIREVEDSLFIGRALYPDTLEQVRLAVNSELRRRVAEGIIYGYDARFTQATLNRDSAGAIDVAYRVFPLPALEFILNTQILLPISAAVA